MEKRFSVIASREGFNGERMMIHKMEDNAVYMTVDEDRKWYKISYEIVPDGTYENSVKRISLPYILHENHAYSLDSFHDWADRK